MNGMSVRSLIWCRAGEVGRRVRARRGVWDLTLTAARTIGLHNMGYESWVSLRSVLCGLDVSKSDVEGTVLAVLSSDDRRIRSWLHWGLPVGFAVQLPFQGDRQVSVRCDLCGDKVSYVPCIRCRGRVGNGVLEAGTADLPLSRRATDWPPGSVEKMAVMRRRAARGRAIFHPEDRSNGCLG